MIRPLLNVLLASTLVSLISGCGDDPKPKKKPTPGFHTNKSFFINVPDQKSPTKEMRNAYMEEFIQKSNIQCQQYLNDPLMKDASKSKSKKELYTGIIDNVSELFGTKGITDGAKSLYPGKKSNDPQKMQLAYERALSPEIMRGVLIARERQMQKIVSKQYRLIESYTVPMLESDMETYDKLCNYEVGLIEINHILENARQPQSAPIPFSSKYMIDPSTIKNKVEMVNKKAEEQQQKRKKSAHIMQETQRDVQTHQGSLGIWNTIDNNTTTANQDKHDVQEQKSEVSVGVFPQGEGNTTPSTTDTLDI